MTDSKKIRVAARQNATELNAEDIGGVSGAGESTMRGTVKCTVVSLKPNEVHCEDWMKD